MIARLGPAAPKVWCGFSVDRAKWLPVDRKMHEDLALAKGTNPACCGRPAQYVIDGTTYCRTHAGETLLRAALDESAGS